MQRVSGVVSSTVSSGLSAPSAGARAAAQALAAPPAAAVAAARARASCPGLVRALGRELDRTCVGRAGKASALLSKPLAAAAPRSADTARILEFVAADLGVDAQEGPRVAEDQQKGKEAVFAGVEEDGTHAQSKDAQGGDVCDEDEQAWDILAGAVRVVWETADAAGCRGADDGLLHVPAEYAYSELLLLARSLREKRALFEEYLVGGYVEEADRFRRATRTLGFKLPLSPEEREKAEKKGSGDDEEVEEELAGTKYNIEFRAPFGAL